MIPQSVCVFGIASKKCREDQFFVLEWSKVQDIRIANQKRWLDAHGEIRLKKPDSMHYSIVEHDLREYRHNCFIITNRL